MLQNVVYQDRPDDLVYEVYDGAVHLTFADNVHEDIDENGEECWVCDLYTLVMPETPNLQERIEANFDLFLDKAKAEDAKAAAEAELAASRLSFDDLLEMTADLFEQVCLLQMGDEA